MTLGKNNKVIVIVGPTASGKSNLAIKLAKKIGGEIISADSRQVYKGMDIGTGKVSRKEQKMIPHHLLDVASPKKSATAGFTADDFKKLGQKALKEIFKRSGVPIVVGGTGFYIDILLGRIQTASVPPNTKLRAKLEKHSPEQLFKKLFGLDFEKASKIDRHNKRRLIRAIEISLYGKNIISDSRIKNNDPKLKILWLGLNPGKGQVASNVKHRLDKRLKQGLIQEIRRLNNNGVSWKRLDAFGLEYRYVSRWLRKIGLKNKSSRFKNSEEYHNLLREIVRYSKRQMTWFRKNEDIKWIDQKKKAEKLVFNFLRQLTD